MTLYLAKNEAPVSTMVYEMTKNVSVNSANMNKTMWPSVR